MARSNTPAAPGPDPIAHVIVLVLKNRSFDHMLAACQAVKPEIDGVPPGGTPRRNQFDGGTYVQEEGAGRIVVEDPRHETPHVLAQLKPDAGGNPSGFVEDYATAYPMITVYARQEVMLYHALGTLPALHTLAQNFTVCDRWFSSVPGPTWTNRLFLMSGTSLGRVNMPGGHMDLDLHWYDQSTIFDRLNERGREWVVYHGDTPLSLLLTHQWDPQNAECYKPMRNFFTDVATREPGKFPAFAFIEPAYLEPGANDDHPPHDVLAGEALIASVYNAVRANQPLWNTTLLVILFDEHGGFYDHVVPPAAIPPDRHQEEYTFDRLGVRVPALLVSPFAANSVFQEQLDHTSLLKYLIDKWQLGPLGERTAQANSFASALRGPARTDTPLSISAVPAQLTPAVSPPRQPLNNHQTALVALSRALESMADENLAIVDRSDIRRSLSRKLVGHGEREVLPNSGPTIHIRTLTMAGQVTNVRGSRNVTNVAGKDIQNTIEDSFNHAKQSVNFGQIGQQLTELKSIVEELCKALEPDDAQAVSRDFADFTAEASSVRPRVSRLKSTGEALVDGAKTAVELAGQSRAWYNQ